MQTDLSTGASDASPSWPVWISFVAVPALLYAGTMVVETPFLLAVGATTAVAVALPAVATCRGVVDRTEGLRWIGVLVATAVALGLGTVDGIPKVAASLVGIGVAILGIPVVTGYLDTGAE